jgi:phospholipase C
MPVVGAVVTVTDASGTTVESLPTDGNGKFTVNTARLTPPFILTVPFTDGDGQPGVMSSAVGGTLGSQHANVNPLSSFIVQQVLGNLTAAPSAQQLSAAHLTDVKFVAAKLAVLAPLQPLFQALKVPVLQADPITAPMVADPASDALDNLIDATHPIVHSNTMVIGEDVNRFVESFAPGTHVSDRIIPKASVQSLQAQLAAGTATPITNVIVIVGENQTFDSLYGAYEPPSGQTVKNLLSAGIIAVDGKPGSNFAAAAQSQAGKQTTFNVSPERTSAYPVLPQPFLTGVLEPTLTLAPNVPDPRFPAALPNGPFQITAYVPYAPTATTPANTGDPVHRFFQMWQQTGGDNSKVDMYVWPAVNVGQGGGTSGITEQNPGQGGELMGFVNMSAGDAPYFHEIATQFAISDNFHQSVQGGTGVNFFALATGDLPYFNINGTPAAPPANQIENPNPTADTVDFYTNDGYEGGSYVNCSDPAQPGVAAIQAVLKGKPSNCDPGKYYLVNNYSPGYDLNGVLQPIGPNNFNYPPQTVPTVAEALAAKGVSWKWYTGARNPADVAGDAAQFHVPVAVAQAAQYNNLGDPLVASSKVVNNPALLAQLAGLTDFATDVAANTLPAVSFVIPKNLSSGHPGYSIVAAYEQFIATTVAQVQAYPALW